jgi:hypothetical protein
MDRTSWGFIIAGLFNAGIIFVSKGFSNDLGVVDPLFGPGGCIGVLLWGLAYMSLAQRHEQAPLVSAVFCLEKAFYAIHWALWISTHGDELEALRAKDPLSAAFFGGYGVGDALFMLFFGYVAWRGRDRLFGPLEDAPAS